MQNEAAEVVMDRGENAELEVKLAIADYFIEQFAGKPESRNAFKVLVDGFWDKYPHHKMLTHFLSHGKESK